ncbi:BirA family transcriptional regulator, biotin operon repressor / biotin-[acetyl-CoA-carboxylase] ligase [Terribacillus halophilus]|uniref:Bifunctional ligase/repressor BirA n=1 Tax=Terribacillus halophilus TaxID=361279 RepID=A0A1G6V3U8_9BACI|nr:biotin--[acetyl-CoA-carboxylase] ligase [Terribacillus halophilus]SDD48320.1 BirA family transcriptional regulator, biotin operon repressor / biotin-[acetyl-CoA-carboxylase] ligase [Terribacillus halophilus]
MDTTRNRLIRILQEHNTSHVSGQYLSEQLGISRAAVWKHMKALEADGYDIDAVPRKGYQVRRSPDKLSKNTLNWQLDTEWIGRKIIFEEELDSTQVLAKSLADQGAVHGTVVLADQQLSGKGTKGRNWHSPAGTGIWMSLIIRPDFGPREAAQLTLAAAVAIARTFHKQGIKAAIKWPNDIYLGDKKLAGILTEMQAEQDYIQHIVLGIGININQTETEIAPDIRQKATSLRIETGKEWNRQELIHLIWKEFEEVYYLYTNKGFQVIRDEWMQYALRLGHRVIATTPSAVFAAVFKGIGEDGELLLENDDGSIQRLYSAELEWKEE